MAVLKKGKEMFILNSKDSTEPNTRLLNLVIKCLFNDYLFLQLSLKLLLRLFHHKEEQIVLYFFLVCRTAIQYKFVGRYFQLLCTYLGKPVNFISCSGS